MMSPSRARVRVDDAGAPPFFLSPRVFRALASPTRARILRALGERPHTPSELSRRIGVSDTTVRAHLDRLRDIGLVERRQDGRVWAYHALTPAARALLAAAPTRAAIGALAGAALAVAGAVSLVQWRARLPEPPPPLSMPTTAPPDPALPWLLGGGIAALALGALLVLAAAWAWRALRQPTRKTAGGGDAAAPLPDDVAR